MMGNFRSVVSGLALLVLSFVIYPNKTEADSGLGAGKSSYAHCSACHLPTGEGVPGLFPPIADSVGKLAAMPSGRAYLVAVVNAGLIGAIEASGTSYNGVMPGFGTILDNQAISAVLNYVAISLGSASHVDFKPFTELEVATLKDKHSPITGNDVHKMRIELAYKSN